ncbi:MAG: MBL fold metallo-hydrolase [Clostridiales bacterium]|nr:MBL fold metallo-hydrolase [Candidatus Blautia equi]
MYELIQLTENDYYFNCPAKIGLVRINDEEVILIDSGNDKDAGKKVFRTLEANGWKLRAIYNTHSHADHIGGNRFLQDKTGCQIYARGLECAYTNAPVLEPAGLYGGLPFKDLKHKFLMAQESNALPLTGDCLPEGLQLLELPGHCFEMTGFLTKDGTAYIADCVSSEETLLKYGIGYLWDVEAAIQTLQYVPTIPAARFVPSHAEVTEDISVLANINISAMESVKEKVLTFCRNPVTFEDLLKQIFDDYKLTMTAQQYVLIGSTIRSYLSSLYTGGKVTFEFEENRMLWHKC